RDGGKPIVPPERQHHTCVQGKRDGGRRRSRGQPLDGKRGRQQVRGGIENPDSRGAHHHVGGGRVGRKLVAERLTASPERLLNLGKVELHGQAGWPDGSFDVIRPSRTGRERRSENAARCR